MPERMIREDAKIEGIIFFHIFTLYYVLISEMESTFIVILVVSFLLIDTLNLDCTSNIFLEMNHEA